MGEPLSDGELAGIRAIAESGTPIGPAAVLGLLDLIAADREAHEHEVFSLKAQVEKWHNALRVDSERHREIEGELRQRGDQWKDSALKTERALNEELCGVREPDVSPLRERVKAAIEQADDEYAGMSEWDGGQVAGVLADAVLPIIATEVTAKVSEAQVAVPEPLAVGVVGLVEEDGRMVTIECSPPGVPTGIGGDVVGIWPADLAEQVADRELDNEGLQRELDAMTAVAKRLDDAWDRFIEDNGPMEEVIECIGDLRALDRLSETREGESDD